MKTALLVALALLVSACSDPEYRLADDKVLCDPRNGNAFYIQENVGDTSFVKAAPAMLDLCKKCGSQT